MSKPAVRIKNWPFGKEEKVKLNWIGEPFKQNNKWMFYAYFKGASATRRILLDWGNVHFLVAEKYYTNGDLNNAEAPQNSKIIDLNIKGIKAEYKERPWEVWGTGFELKTKSKTFNFTNKGEFYTVPIIEIIRAVLAPDSFMLYRILELNTLDNYFTYEMIKDSLQIFFTKEYEEKFLKSDKINHLAWLITNINALRMFDKIAENLWFQGELKFDFLLENFYIKARVEKKATYTKILEILSLKRKKINAEEINIYHPSLEEVQSSNQAKIRKYVNKNSDPNIELTSEGDGSTKAPDEVNTELLEHEYEKLPPINKKKQGRRIARSAEDENTKKYIFEDDRLRTTADTGGEALIRGLEFKNLDKIEEKGELSQFVEMLKLLEKRKEVSGVNIIIGELPDGKRGKRFSRLSDGITRRRYAIGQVIMCDGREYSLIDVEREDRALSMLILKAVNKINWNWIYSELLIGLVDESGKWSNEVFEELKRCAIFLKRIKHTSRSNYEKAIFIVSLFENNLLTF